MKKKGSKSDFLAARDKELHKRFMEILRDSRGIPLRDMYGMAAQRPSSRFWVSEDHATEIISAMRRNREIPRQLEKRADMYREIYRRVEIWEAANPGHTLTDAVCEVVHQEAPEFYLTPDSAKMIIYNYRRKCRR